MDRSTLAILSTFSAILPIIMGSIAIKRHPLVKWFIAFLLFGLFTDFITALTDSSFDVIEENAFTRFLQNLYSLVDSFFLFWFLGKVVNEKKLSKVLFTFAAIMIPLWIMFSFIVKNTLENGHSLSEYFDTGYEMLLAVSAAYVLLTMTEQGRRNPNQSLLWLVIGIFFFNFCCFFIHAFISNQIAEHIWFLGNLINILTMLMYTFAFCKLRNQ